MHIRWAVSAVMVAAVSTFGQEAAGLARVRDDADRLRPLIKTEFAGGFLEAVSLLPEVTPRTLYVDPATREWFDQAARDTMDEARLATLKERPADETFYYNTKYGSPLAYARPFDLVSPLIDLKGRRILDFGYGTAGHLRLLASQGCEAVGVDVDPMLPVLYSLPGDQGPMPALPGVEPGTVRLVHGRWPGETPVKAAAGGGLALFISKNTLKNGYLHPAQEVDKRMLVDLGVPDEPFVREVYAAIEPGGVFLIYNLCPAPSKKGEPYKPWADGRCPFPREMLEGAGFRVEAFDVDDTAAAREMGRALAWDAEGMDLENDLFAWYTIAIRPAAGGLAPAGANSPK